MVADEPIVVKYIDIPFVKYADERISEVKTTIPLMFNNTNDYQLWAKITIEDQGKYAWVYDSGATETVVSLPANSPTVLKLVVKPGQNIQYTTLDIIRLHIVYYEDDTLTQIYGEDIVYVWISLFFQNPDLSWTSEDFPDEDRIVYEKWTNAFDTLEPIDLNNNDEIHEIPGDNGVATLRFHYWEERDGCYGRIVRDNYLVELNSSLKLLLFGVDSYGARWSKTMISVRLQGSDIPIYDKFVAFYIKNSAMTDCRVGLTSAPDNGDIITHNVVGSIGDGQVKKFALIPFSNLTPFIYCYEYGKNTTGYVWIDGLYIFNSLNPPIVQM